MKRVRVANKGVNAQKCAFCALWEGARETKEGVGRGEEVLRRVRHGGLAPFDRLRGGRMRMVPATAGSPQVLVGCSAGWGASVPAQGSTEQYLCQ